MGKPKKRKVVREYPDDWPTIQEGLFLAEVRRNFGVPAFCKTKFKKLRMKRMIRATWEWEIEE